MRKLTPFFALALLLACEAPGERRIAASHRIIGGEPESGDPAIVMLASWSSDLTELDLCTATLIAPKVLLTAAHCVDADLHPDGNFGVFTGANANGFPSASTLVPQLSPIEEIHIHPDYDPDPPFTADIAVITLPEALAAAPLPVLTTEFDQALVGEAARIVGYGQTAYDQPNAQKHSANTIIAGIDDGDTITVGDLDRRSCIGDSGGPALVVLNGVETVVGVNSYTDLAGCLEPAHYRRTDMYEPFLAEFVSFPTEGGSGGGGGSESTGSGAAASSSEASAGGGSTEESGGGCAVNGSPTLVSPAWLWLVGLLLGRHAIRRTRQHH